MRAAFLGLLAERAEASHDEGRVPGSACRAGRGGPTMRAAFPGLPAERAEAFPR
jgi:hypothetical protein